MPTSPDTTVIGVGNLFHRDEGVGSAVINLLRDRRTGARLALCDGAPTALVEAWTGTHRAVVVVAVRVAGGSPGRIHRYAADHPAELDDAVTLARVLDRMPGTLQIFGVQAADVHFGHGLSPAVAAAARQLADEIAALLADTA
jgi:hydrogenase maturation protease